MGYRPLREGLTIKQSGIEGLGLFTEVDISKDECLGISHWFIENELHRTPLGGFYNHSDDPNCFTKELGVCVELYTKRDIKAGEELTAIYTVCPLTPRAWI